VTAPTPERDTRAEAIRTAFSEFLASQGYDEDGMFDVEEMELAFETGMLVRDDEGIRQLLAAARPHVAHAWRESPDPAVREDADQVLTRMLRAGIG